MHLSLQMQFLVGGLFLLGLLFIAFSYPPLKIIKRIRAGIDNRGSQTLGENIVVEGVVTTPNLHQTPVFETPVAAAYWTIKYAGSTLSTSESIVGAGFEVVCENENYKIQIREYDVLCQDSGSVPSDGSIRPNQLWNRSIVNFPHGIDKKRALDNFLKLLKREGHDLSILGIRNDLFISEYPIESQKKYSILGKLVQPKTIASDDFDTLVIFESPISNILRKLRIQILVFQFVGLTLFGGAIAVYFHLKNL